MAFRRFLAFTSAGIGTVTAASFAVLAFIFGLFYSLFLWFGTIRQPTFALLDFHEINFNINREI